MVNSATFLVSTFIYSSFMRSLVVNLSLKNQALDKDIFYLEFE
jgi:hypothetical protein